MKHLFIIMFFTFFHAAVQGQDLIYDWKKELNSKGRSQGLDILHHEGAIYTCGYFENDFQIDTLQWKTEKAREGYFMKLTPEGKVSWAKRFQSHKNVSITSITADDEDRIFIAGTYVNKVRFDTVLQTYHLDTFLSSNAFMACYHTDGKLLWAKTTGATAYPQTQIHADKKGNVFLAGRAVKLEYLDAQTPFFIKDSLLVTWTPGTPYYTYFQRNDGFLAKYDRQGTLSWATGTGGNVQDITTDTFGNVVVTGTFGFEENRMPGDQAHHYGALPVTKTGTYSPFIAKHLGDGTVQWIQVMGGSSNNNESNGILTDADGNIFQVGGIGGNHVHFDGQDLIDLVDDQIGFAAKWNANGQLQWMLPIGNPNFSPFPNNGGTDIQWTPRGTLLTSFYFQDHITFNNQTFVSNGGADLLLLEMDADGNVIKGGQDLLFGWNNANAITLDAEGNIYLTGFNDDWNSSLPTRITLGKLGPELLTATSFVPHNLMPICYPNPARVGEKIHFLTSPDEDIRIYDTRGRLFFQGNANAEVKLVQPGIYFVKIPRCNYSFKLIVE